MTLPAFLAQHQLDNSLLLGFYGGGNYGDELLMEVLAGLLQQQNTQNVSIAYQQPQNYTAYHHDFGYPLVDMHNKKAVATAVLHKKRIVVGGGGLWGMDVNPNVLLMSIMLFASRWLLHKKVYLLAVGRYNSTPRMGRISAWLAGKAANAIIARDDETYQNFKRIQKHTYQDNDIAWYIDQLNLEPYEADVTALEHRLHITGKTIFITLRRFRGNDQHHLAAVVGQCLEQNAGKHLIIALMEPRSIDPEGFNLLQSWRHTYPNLQVIDFAYNPLALFLFFRKHCDNLVFIGPQFHAILSAHLTGVPYLPLAYDNKVRNLLQHIAPQAQPITVQALQPQHIQEFIDRAYAPAT
ncbi:MAG TPA: polysaccharide pyruvyl transferase family protein [Nevskiaceae bacterium]|nr:polysaccharide pyruvyl transferase family protein [Nevskiaceae bacterium]